MIPSASALPLPVPAPELADPALASGPDSRQADADAPSFASHLDQFMPLASSHRPDPLANRPPPAIARRDADNAPQNASLAVKTNANAQASSDAKDPTVTSPANSDAQTPDDANTAIDKPVRSSKENKEDKAESKNDDKAANMVQTAAVTSLAPVPLPLTPATLAITVGIVPVPVSVSVQQTDSKDARTSASCHSRDRSYFRRVAFSLSPEPPRRSYGLARSRANRCAGSSQRASSKYRCPGTYLAYASAHADRSENERHNGQGREYAGNAWHNAVCAAQHAANACARRAANPRQSGAADHHEAGRYANCRAACSRRKRVT